MKRKHKPKRRPDRPERTEQPREEHLQGPPPAEATIMHTDRDRRVEEELERHTETSPALSGGDLDADWQRASSVGEEAAGGSVATPDQSVVDDLGTALGVPRAPDEAFRTSQEILEKRDSHRIDQER
jgi:hypothetical protein